MSSRRNYLGIPELEEYANITVTDESEAYDQISQAEEMIDAYVGFQTPFLHKEMIAKVSSAVDKTLYDVNNTVSLFHYNNYFAGCWLEIIGGTGIGQLRRIVSSDFEQKSVTYEGASLSPAADETTVFRIYQLGKFPRADDVRQIPNDTTYYKFIPEAVRRAVAAQVQFMINMGEDFFANDASDKTSENFGNYSYSKGGASKSGTISKLIAPKAKTLLRGYVRLTGTLVPNNPTRL